nr:hypothetical protein [Tanacetum cinerariifolium]GEX06569.1 hypothetical protein [Tanacetum cinerariifolium]
MSLLNDARMVFAIDPTQGFANVPSNFIYQKPYNVPLESRYSYDNGVRRFWVYSNDKPFKRGSNTRPRTEAHIKPDYTSGIWQFEGYAFVPHGTSGATILQIHVLLMSSLNDARMVFAIDPTQGFTIVPLTSSSFIYQKPYNVPLESRYSFDDGVRRFWVYSNDEPFERGSNTRPRTEAQIKVNLIHNVDEGRLTVYINDVEKFASHDQGPGDLYFKCGVYGAPSDTSKYMESRWRDIKIYKK